MGSTQSVLRDKSKVNGSNGFQPEGKIDQFSKLILKHLKYKTLVSAIANILTSPIFCDL